MNPAGLVVSVRAAGEDVAFEMLPGPDVPTVVAREVRAGQFTVDANSLDRMCIPVISARPSASYGWGTHGYPDLGDPHVRDLVARLVTQEVAPVIVPGAGEVTTVRFSKGERAALAGAIAAYAEADPVAWRCEFLRFASPERRVVLKQWSATLPETGSPVVGGVSLPPGSRWAPFLGPDPDPPILWATDAPIADPCTLAARLADAFPVTGLWPVLGVRAGCSYPPPSLDEPRPARRRTYSRPRGWRVTSGSGPV